jgi:hypothetical protein
MEKTLMEPKSRGLEDERQRVLEAMSSLSVFRRGTVSVNYRRCGKPTCHCAREGERGHGPQYLWNATIGGKSYAKNIRGERELARYRKETEGYREFLKLCERFVAVNEQLCESSALSEALGSEDVKKKLQKRARKSLRRK